MSMCGLFGSAPDLNASVNQSTQTLLDITGSPPVLDLARLGLGPDGHTSLAGPRGLSSSRSLV